LPVNSAVFNVATIEELYSAVMTAAGNDADDTINISAGTYILTSTLTYDSSEDHALII